MSSADRTRDSRSSGTYPLDRFDRLARSDRTGAHRITARSRRLSLYVWCGLILSVLLIACGVIWVNVVSGNVSTGSPAVSGTESQPTPDQIVVDPEAQLVILNGTGIDGLQWTVENAITAGAWGQVLFSEYASERDVQISAIFYRDPADEAAAHGLGTQLGGIATYLTENYAEYAELGARFVVLLGADYAGPGLEEALAPPAAEPAEEFGAEGLPEGEPVAEEVVQ